MSLFCKEIKKYCLEVIKDPLVDSFTPTHYVEHIQKLAEEMGLPIPSTRLVQGVRNGRRFNVQVANLFIELAKRNQAKVLSDIKKKDELKQKGA